MFRRAHYVCVASGVVSASVKQVWVAHGTKGVLSPRKLGVRLCYITCHFCPVCLERYLKHPGNKVTTRCFSAPHRDATHLGNEEGRGAVEGG